MLSLPGEAASRRAASSTPEPVVRGFAPSEGDQQVSGVQVSTEYSAKCLIFSYNKFFHYAERTVRNLCIVYKRGSEILSLIRPWIYSGS